MPARKKFKTHTIDGRQLISVYRRLGPNRYYAACLDAETRRPVKELHDITYADLQMNRRLAINRGTHIYDLDRLGGFWPPCVAPPIMLEL